MKNSLLEQGPLPEFSHIVPKDIEPALKEILSKNHKKIHELLSASHPFTWDNLMAPLEEMGDRLSKFWSPISHLNSVMETDDLRAAYNACLPLLTEYSTELMQNETLYKAIQSIANSSEYAHLTVAQQKVISNDLRDFRLAGVALPQADKARFAVLQQELSKLSTKFSENILDSSNAWSMEISDSAMLAGLPESALNVAEQNAKQRNLKGWLLTLDYPCYSAVMKYLTDRNIRRTMYEAYVTRASDQGPNAGRWDNTQVMEDILKIRYELAKLVGFANYAEYSLATKMAKTPDKVLGFLNDLVTRSQSVAQKDIQDLAAFAQGIDKLEAWDLPYYSEKLRQQDYAISQEDVRPYFPVPKVLAGMFEVVSQLYGIKIEERTNVDVWHPHVQFFDIYDANETLRGCFYIDLYARRHKRDGAWMDEARVRRLLSDGSIQYPVAYLTCNFTPPLENKVAYITHDEVQTLFHEFGHGLHHLLTKVEVASVSGINGVPWDAVEFPSQFLENFCWQKTALTLISEHETTKKPLPDELYKKLLAAKNFQPGLYILRQLEFALFDFRMHLEYVPGTNRSVQDVLDGVRKIISVVPVPSFNRFQHSFSHIFSGGYAAGYYSYVWAELLASDAFSLFEEKGVFNRAVGQAFLENILEQGGTRDPMDLFIAFRGREPKIDALLKQHGLAEASMEKNV